MICDVASPTSTLDEHGGPPADGPEAPAPGAATGRAGRAAAWVSGVVRRYPATAALVVLCVGAGLVTGAAWRGISEGDSLYDAVAYGLPALREGRWWTFFTGAFFVPQIVLYIPILVLLVAAASTYERRVGHWRALGVVVGGQAFGSMLTAGFLYLFRDTGWTWAVELGRELDLGISAGGFAVFGALTAVMQPTWRVRVRAAVTAYLIAMLLNAGLLWDVEHLVSWTLGMAAGPLLAGRRPVQPAVRFGRRLQRSVVALVVAVSALSALLAAIWQGNGGPFHAGDDAYHPSGVTLALVVSSIVWLALADGLRRGRRFAWGLTTGLMALSFLSLLAVDASSERTADLVITGGLLLLLLVTYRAFTARSPQHSFRRAGGRLLKVALGLFAYTAIGFAVLQDDFVPRARPADMVAEFVSRLFFSTSGNIEPATDAAELFVRSIALVWIGAIIVTVIGLVYASRRPRPEPEQDARLRALLLANHSSSIEWMLTWRGNTVWFSADGETAIGFRVVGSVALCLADPVGPAGKRLAAMQEFDAFCFERGWLPCMFAASEETAALAPELRWKAVEVAEDGVVGLEGLEFKGKAWQDVRTAMNKAGKLNIRLEKTRWAEAKPVLTDQLHVISNGWVSDKSLPEMGFTLGTLREADDPEVRLHVAMDEDSTVEGFTSWMPVGEDGEVIGWTLDLMRRRDEGFRPVMEYLIGASALEFKDEGFRFISLSAAPLARAPDHLAGSSDQRVLQKLLDFLGDSLEPYYGFRSLHAFKTKFQPVFRPMYLVFPDESTLLEIGVAIARAYMPDAGLKDWAMMTWDMAKPGRG